MASRTNCVINGIPYYKMGRIIGKDQNGKPIKKWFYGKTKKEAMQKYQDEKDKKHTVGKDEPLMVVLKYYIYEVLWNSNKADGTKVRYETVYRLYIKDSQLTRYKTSEINSRAIQQFINSLTEESDSIVNAIKKVLSNFFKYAEAENLCRNPMPNVVTPKRTKKKNDIIVFTKEEIEKINNSIKDGVNSTYRFMFIFALGTGLRQGELRGLKFGDVKNGEIQVVKQITRSKEKTNVYSDTKSVNSVRQVPMPLNLTSQFAEYRKCAKRNKDSDLVFCTEAGLFIDKSNLIRSYRRFLASLDVPYKSFHVLRKTYATLLCEGKVPITTVANLIGDTVPVASQYYAFISNESRREAVGKLDSIFCDQKK